MSTFAPDRYEHYDLRADAGRFETGYLNFPGIYPLSRSIPYLLNVGVDQIAHHVGVLGDVLVAELQHLGLDVMSPIDTERRGASVSFAHSKAPEIGRALVEQGVHVWAGDGRVRASTHLFNGSNDLDRYLDALHSVLQLI
jgi:selenocysteine lyase/cysteine desulfurase